MRALALLLLAALPAAAHQSVARPAEGLQSWTLAARIESALPTMGALDLRVPALNAGVSPGIGFPAGPADLKVVPAIYKSEKAQALLGVLRGEGAAPALSVPVLATPEEAKRTVAAVNAVLRDFTAQDIEKLSGEEAAALSGLLFDHMGVAREPDQAADVAALAALSRVSAARVLAKAGKPTTELLLNPRHNESHPDDIEVHGVPAETRAVAVDGVVWRHYRAKSGFQSLLSEQALYNGYVPYVQLARGLFKKTFKDVGGMFLTVPGVDGREVGVPAREFPHFADVLLPAALTVLEVEAGKIWLVPLPRRSRDWLVSLYRRWADGGEPDRTYLRGLMELDQEGGPGPRLAAPVKIVASGAAS